MKEKTYIRHVDENVIKLKIQRLRAFTNHLFKIVGESKTIELRDSIKIWS